MNDVTTLSFVQRLTARRGVHCELKPRNYTYLAHTQYKRMEYFVEPLVLQIASGAKAINYNDKNIIFVNITQNKIQKGKCLDADDNNGANICYFECKFLIKNIRRNKCLSFRWKPRNKCWKINTSDYSISCYFSAKIVKNIFTRKSIKKKNISRIPACSKSVIQRFFSFIGSFSKNTLKLLLVSVPRIFRNTE